MGGSETEVLASPRAAAAPPAPPTPRSRLWVVEVALVVVLVVAVFFVHDVGYMLRHPFWLDEAWVALSTRAPLHDLPLITSATPIGFTFLLRLVPGDAEQRFRLVPLFFSAGAVIAAYLLGRELRLTKVTTGLLLAAAVLMSRAMLVRSDLKQYTAEACTTVVLLLLLARLETKWTRGRLVALGAVCALGMLIAHTTAFTGSAVLLSLAIVAVARREWDRFKELLVVGVVVLVCMATIYLVFDHRHQLQMVVEYWHGWYVPVDRGPGAVWSYLTDRVPAVFAYLGTRNIVVVALLAAGGLATLVWIKRPALALAVPITIVITVGASSLEKYPFPELRTSTFWLVGVTLLMAIGVAGAARLAGGWHTVAGYAVVAIALVLIVAAGEPSVRGHLHPIFDEDVRAQVHYLDAHRRADDVVLVNWSASYAYSYYDRSFQPGFVGTKRVQMGYYPTAPHQPRLILMQDRRPQDVDAALARARRLVGPDGGDVWIVRSHSKFTREGREWGKQLQGQQVDRYDVGPEVLLRYRVPARTSS